MPTELLVSALGIAKGIDGGRMDCLVSTEATEALVENVGIGMIDGIAATGASGPAVHGSVAALADKRGVYSRDVVGNACALHYLAAVDDTARAGAAGTVGVVGAAGTADAPCVVGGEVVVGAASVVDSPGAGDCDSRQKQEAAPVHVVKRRGLRKERGSIVPQSEKAAREADAAAAAAAAAGAGGQHDGRVQKEQQKLGAAFGEENV